MNVKLYISLMLAIMKTFNSLCVIYLTEIFIILICNIYVELVEDRI